MTANHATISQENLAVKTITYSAIKGKTTTFDNMCTVTSLHFYRELTLFFAVSKMEEVCHKKISTYIN
jgi:hypothetical protein